MTTQLSMFDIAPKQVKNKSEDYKDNLRREIYKLRQERSVMLSSKSCNQVQWATCVAKIEQIEKLFKQNNWDLDNFGPLFAGL